MDRMTVELDHDLLRPPEAIDLIEATANGKVGVEMRPRQADRVEQDGEPLFELVAGDACPRGPL